MDQKIPHRRARIVDAVAELFLPLMEWRPELAYKGAETKMRKMEIAEKTGDIPIYKEGIRRSYDGRIYETTEDIGPNNEPPPDNDLWTEIQEYPRTDLLMGKTDDDSLFTFKTVQKEFSQWTSLVDQGAVPALMMLPGDGDKSEAHTVGYVEEEYPIMLTVVLIDKPDYSLIDQASDAHYAMERMVNNNRDLGVRGVDPTQTQLGGRRVSGPALFPAFLIEFQLMIVHEYRATESV